MSEPDEATALPGIVPDDLPDAVLVVRSQRQDRRAFEQLVRRTARLVWSRLYLETGSADRADDLSQETFLLAWRSIKHLAEPAGFRAWLLTVARSVAVDAARREARKKRAGTRVEAEALEAIAHRGDGPPEVAERNESRRRVLAVLRSLPEDHRQVLILRYLAGADYQSIAQQLGLSNGSLRGLLNRGMAMMRDKMRTDE